ncbi:universal stress protein [Aquimarina sp. 2201CG1-2-11]|uniref:universal stress protein n=1 Tax=Aquimarina discodermiae TaxID=3231043 RepID=UPI0034622491
MKKNILIPIDFSENSWNAISYALSFFENVNCNFHLLHVVNSERLMRVNIPLYEPEEIVVRKTSQKNKEQMNSFLKRIKKITHNKNHLFFTTIEYGLFIDVVRKQVIDRNINYIVMGTKGASGLKEKIIGTNTGDVITKVKCSLLVIPEKASYTRINEIAFPTDYNIYYKNKVLSTITEILTLTKSSLRVLHVSKKEQDLTDLQKNNKYFLEDVLQNQKYSFHFLSNVDLETAVQCFVESRDIDMITMVAKNLNFFQRILFQPTVEKISYHISIPFLVLHE